MHKTILVPKLMHLFIKEHFKGKYTWHTCLPPPFSPPPLKRDIENCIKLKAFIPFYERNEIKIASRQWNGNIHVDQVMPVFPKNEPQQRFSNPH